MNCLLEPSERTRLNLLKLEADLLDPQFAESVGGGPDVGPAVGGGLVDGGLVGGGVLVGGGEVGGGDVLVFSGMLVGGGGLVGIRTGGVSVGLLVGPAWGGLVDRLITRVGVEVACDRVAVG